MADRVTIKQLRNIIRTTQTHDWLKLAIEKKK